MNVHMAAWPEIQHVSGKCKVLFLSPVFFIETDLPPTFLLRVCAVRPKILKCHNCSLSSSVWLRGLCGSSACYSSAHTCTHMHTHAGDTLSLFSHFSHTHSWRFLTVFPPVCDPNAMWHYWPFPSAAPPLLSVMTCRQPGEGENTDL